MMFWLLAALLTLVATLSVLVPLTRRQGAPLAADGPDVEVYRDQLRELDADRARGLIDEGSAAEARGEIGRRILKAATPAAIATTPSSSSGRWLMFVAVISVPLVSWGLYARIGSPELPAEPLAARLAKNPTQGSVEQLLARVERHLADHPDDGRGWDVLAPVYLRVGAYDKAVTAYRNAIRLLGATAARQTALGEAVTAEAGGNVTPDALAAFTEATKLDASAIEPRFFLATALAQEGRFDEAETQFKALQPLAANDKRWQDEIAAALTEIAKRRTASAAGGASGPNAADVEAAGQMTGAQRLAMIEGMVAKLDAHLKSDPGDVEGWKRLVRSYVVLGRQDQARDALARGGAAIAASAGPDARTAFEEFARGLGVTVADPTPAEVKQ